MGKEKVCQAMTLANSSALSQEKLDRMVNFLTTTINLGSTLSYKTTINIGKPLIFK